MPRGRTLVEVFGAHDDAVKDGIRTGMPGIVTEVTGQTCSVQLAMHNPLWRWENDLVPVTAPIEYEDPPVLTDVPITPLRAGGFVVWLPVTVGDCVWVAFSDLSTDTWRQSDGTQPVKPGFIGKHTHDSPYCFPFGTQPDSKALTTAAPAGSLVVGKDGTHAQIVIDGSTVSIGATPSGFVAMASLVATELNKIASALSSAVAPPGAGGGPITYGAAYTSPGSVAATVAKAQ